LLAAIARTLTCHPEERGIFGPSGGGDKWFSIEKT
jgi:hypothetical protein